MLIFNYNYLYFLYNDSFFVYALLPLYTALNTWSLTSKLFILNEAVPFINSILEDPATTSSSIRNVTVPVGSYATVHVPVSANSFVTESGQAIETVSGIEKMGIEDGYLKVNVMQGSYQFKN